MNTVLIACAVALAATAILAVVFLLVRRSQSEDRLADVVERFNDRMESMVRDVSRALDRAQEEVRPARAFGELTSSIDLDEVLTRTLEAAAACPGVDAAVVAVDEPSAPPVSAAIGIALDDSPRPALSAPPDGSAPRSISIVYEYGPHDSQAEDSIRAGVAVPLISEGELVGYLAAYTRGSVHLFGEAQVRALEELALRAGPAIQNARRFREARQLADLDALTGLHNRRYFHETLAREIARAKRYDRSLALVVLDLDDLKAINDRIGHLGGDAVLAEVAERVRDVVRSADVACRVGGDEFAVILPESSVQDADQLYRRLQAAVSSRPVGHAGPLHLSAGVTELRSDDDAVSFFQRADEALYRAKGAGKGDAAIS
ncbi:MAG: sensor domain-containing diguanylate cyclase [Actinobacteria bacterium]|nr:sensor domain-containing diguanylate cyclase [Actinomycetota bacterium]